MDQSESPRHPLPETFTGRIRQQFPDDHSGFLKALDTKPAASIRINPDKMEHLSDGTPAHTPAPVTHRVPWSQNGWFLRERPSYTLDPLLHAGAYYVQEASSMFLEHVLALPELREQSGVILDACAAPGGKSTLIAAQFPDSLVVANEVIRSRVPALLENSIKWGSGNLVITQNETGRIAALTDFFDLVVADAPCSGEGLFRKDPSARTEWSAAHAQHCAIRQRSILADLWKSIRPGGYMIYTTCTFNPEENERNIAWFLGESNGECLKIPMPPDCDAIREISTGPVTGYGFYPHLTSGEGFFLTLIRKPGRAHERHARRPYLRARQITEPGASAVSKTARWFTGDEHVWFQIKERLHHIHSSHIDSLHIIASMLSVRYAGTETGKIIRDEIRPAPPAALDIHLDAGHFPQIDCSHEDALSFLRRESLPVPEDSVSGWHLAMYRGLPLGWLKNIGSRMNNYHPKEWRIRQRNIQMPSKK